MEDFFEENTDSTPKSDIIFKILFGNPKHPRLLIHLLNAIIRDEKPITEVDIKQTELTPEFLKGKGIRLDVLAKTSDGQLINIEIQKENEHNMVPRSLFYWSKIFAGQAVVNEKYEDLKRTICINIMNFRLFEDGRYWRKVDGLYVSKLRELYTDMDEFRNIIGLFLLEGQFCFDPCSEAAYLCSAGRNLRGTHKSLVGTIKCVPSSFVDLLKNSVEGFQIDETTTQDSLKKLKWC